MDIIPATKSELLEVCYKPTKAGSPYPAGVEEYGFSVALLSVIAL